MELDQGLYCYLTEKHLLPYFLSPFLLSLFPVQELTDSDLIHYFYVETWGYKLFGFFVLPSSGDYEKTAMMIIGLMREAPVMLCFQSNSQNAMLRSCKKNLWKPR